MVSHQSSIGFLRNSVPVLGFIALVAVFLKLPEMAILVSQCKSCHPPNPYMPLIGCGYFGLLIAFSLLFPSFPRAFLARGGFVCSLLLAFILTYLPLPSWCFACLIAHGCNILIWGIWALLPSRRKSASSKIRLYLALFAPISLVALFSSTNLTLMAYRLPKAPHTGLRTGDPIPLFSAETVGGLPISHLSGAGTVFNFVAPNCPYCKEQLQILRLIAPNAQRIVNISPKVPPEFMQCSPDSEWVEDKDLLLQKLFKIEGFPTLYIVGSDEKIAQVILGVPINKKGSK